MPNAVSLLSAIFGEIPRVTTPLDHVIRNHSNIFLTVNPGLTSNTTRELEVCAAKMDKKLAKKLAKMSEEERAQFLEQQRLQEEEMQKKKEEMLSRFLKVELHLLYELCVNYTFLCVFRIS